MDEKIAIEKLRGIKNIPKFEAMLLTASVITQLLDKQNIKPIIVGGLSVEIYTQNEYTTRDIDFVSDGYQQISNILFTLGFQKEGRYFYHEGLEIAIEIPASDLAGDYSRVTKLEIDDENYVYVISVEDIIMDRLRAAVHWKSVEDHFWAAKMLASNFTSIDKGYLFSQTESPKETELLNEWMEQLERDFNE
ncbi:hypothetical protein F3157_05175 [Virgibacillus dakarensis]|uniref:DUF6036 domain-containing protein n=1 Tax=Lentibacillus populi TaxID=1827502 RepID=A0A9W5X4I3_9BACI|nr:MULTISPECIES: DUF6036 family nucleotidyltransferase [Bacillaceae]MBT2214370.1 hypothetical protein [Virgibacillus dakarensis]MTW85049.1 hypothetical protein [Virgibacillus dakarensis]GGB34332.1 hypothetical protein GCM10011409_09740 [Lentibacillus populi]